MKLAITKGAPARPQDKSARAIPQVTPNTRAAQTASSGETASICQGLISEWEAKADVIQEFNPTDPVANTIRHCAAHLRVALARARQIEWISPDEYGKRYNVTPQTVRNWARQGRINAQRAGNKWRINGASVRKGGEDVV